MTAYLVQINGVRFRGPEAQQIIHDLEPGDWLQLEAEPTNKFDANAIKVLRHGEHLGYVQADMAAHLVARLTPDVEATVSDHRGTNGNYLVEIRLPTPAVSSLA